MEAGEATEAGGIWTHVWRAQGVELDVESPAGRQRLGWEGPGCRTKGPGLYADDAGMQAGILRRQRTQAGDPGGAVVSPEGAG